MQAVQTQLKDGRTAVIRDATVDDAAARNNFV